MDKTSPGTKIAEEMAPIIGIVNLKIVTWLAFTYFNIINHKVKAMADINTKMRNKNIE